LLSIDLSVSVWHRMLLDDRDHTGKLDLAGLPADQRIFVEVSCLDLGDYRTLSEPLRGSFVTPPSGRRDVRFVCGRRYRGQGWGINPDFGGMRIYDTMRAVQPDFFIHSGDTVYADGPIAAEVTWPTAAYGATWSPRRRPRWPRPWTSSAASTATT
jgi:alkaline phosphatase D